MPWVSESGKYFSLVADRECGECMVCCQCLSIDAPGLKKPADILCNNCILNVGCSIYETRPNVCRTWHCLWRRVAALPDEIRPDRSNVVFSLKVSFEPRHIFENAYIVCMTLTDPSAFDTPAVSAAIDLFVEEYSLPVWLSHGGCKSLIWPEKELADAIANPFAKPCPLLKNKASQWTRHYNALIEPLQDQQAMFGREFLLN